MTRIWLDDAVLFDPEAPGPAPGSLLIEDGRIAARLEPGRPAPADAQRVALGGARLAPGLIDVHFHGALPAGTPDDAASALLAASASLARHGVTAFLATTVAWPADDLRERVERLVEALDRGSWPGAAPHCGSSRWRPSWTARGLSRPSCRGAASGSRSATASPTRKRSPPPSPTAPST